jgi:hypothetical protein
MTTDREAIEWVVQHLQQIGLQITEVNTKTGHITLSIHSPVTRRYDSTGKALPPTT